MSKTLDKRVRSLEKGNINAKRLAYLTQSRADISTEQALRELVALPPDEMDFYLQTLSDQTLEALDVALATAAETNQ